MDRRNIPIGTDDFRKLRSHGRYYVDKTALIREFWDDGAEVLLLTRPRRFGKTLNLSMLRYFFEKGNEGSGSLFEGLTVSNDDVMMAEQGQYAVIYLDFKSIKFLEWKEALSGIRNLLKKTCQRLEIQYPTAQLSDFRDMDQPDFPLDRVQSSMLDLCEALHQATGQPVLVFIDEYDSPLLEAWISGYYEEMSTFLRGLLGSLLKGNPYLKKAMLTGILRVAKESIFSDLNNLDVYSILAPEFSQYFGFTSSEVEKVLNDFEMDPSRQQVLQEWYNGYLFGEEVIYNPWSILEYVKHQPQFPQRYWANTGGNAIVRQLILEGTNADIQQDMEMLLQDQCIEGLSLDEHIVLRDIRGNREELWSFLTFSGYLKPTNPRWDEFESCTVYDLVSPNREVREFYRHTVRDWLRHQIGRTQLEGLLNTLVQKDWPIFHQRLQDLVLHTLSFHDTAGIAPEKVYHAFILGLLLSLPDYKVQSNRESGYGRYDAIVIPNNPKKPGFVFEFKRIQPPHETHSDVAMESALHQIQTQDYAAQLRAEGVRDITGIGIVIDGKQIWVDTVTLG